MQVSYSVSKYSLQVLKRFDFHTKLQFLYSYRAKQKTNKKPLKVGIHFKLSDAIVTGLASLCFLLSGCSFLVRNVIPNSSRN